MLLLAPWGPRRRRALVGLAIAAGAVWMAMTTSVLIESSHAADAVVVEATTLRVADNAGAPAALSTPVPSGAEVTVDERRGGWARVSLPGGGDGWLPDGAVALVTPEPD